MTGMVAPGIRIYRDVPLPRPTKHPGRSGRPRLYHWDRMEVGDSIIAPTQRILQAAIHWASTNGRRFVSRKTSKGHRVWRVS